MDCFIFLAALLVGSVAIADVGMFFFSHFIFNLNHIKKYTVCGRLRRISGNVHKHSKFGIKQQQNACSNEDWTGDLHHSSLKLSFWS